MKIAKINLLPTAARFQLSQIKLAKRLKEIAYLVVAFWLVLVVALLSVRIVLDQQKKKVLAQRTQLENSLKQLAPQMQLQQALRFRFKLAAEVLAGRPSMAKKIQEVESLLPEGSTIKTLRIRGSSIEVSGKILTLAALAEFEQQLNETAKKKYSQVKVRSLSKEDNKWSFILELNK